MHLSIAVDPTNSKRIIENLRLAVTGFVVTGQNRAFRILNWSKKPIKKVSAGKL
jgi:hypothetical protein